MNTEGVSITTSRTRGSVGSTLLVLASLALGGCGSTGDGGQPASPSAGVSPQTSASASASGPKAAACATPDLRVSVSRGEGAAGSTYYSLRLTNTSPQPCRTGGFGGVSLVGTPTGAPIGAPAARVDKGQAKPLRLPPGAHADAVLQVGNAGNYDKATCRPVAAKGLRVYPPNETRSLFVPLAATACRSSDVQLLSLSPYRVGG